MDEMLNANITLRDAAGAPASHLFADPFARTARHVQWLDRSQDSLWDEFVDFHPLGTVCQTTRWRDAIETSFSHIQGRALVIRDSAGAIQCGTMIYRVRSWLLGDRLVSVPFGSRVDPLVSSAADLAELIQFLSAYRAETAVRSLQIRVSEAPVPPVADDLTVRWILKRHYLRLCDGIEPIWSNLTPELRRTIRRAGRQGVHVRLGNGRRDWDLFFELHGRTRQRVQMPVAPRRFFESLERQLRPTEWELLIAERNGEALAAGLLLIFNGVEQGDWLGDTAVGRSLNANQRLHWETIERATARGCHTFCFGRTDASHQGLLAYKRRWGCIEQDMPIISSRAEPGPLKRRADIRIARRVAQHVIDSSPWPLFVKFSGLCFRHLG